MKSITQLKSMKEARSIREKNPLITRGFWHSTSANDETLKLYKQYVRPHLECSSPAWSPWLAGDKEVLEKVQEKPVKMLTGLKARFRDTPE